MEFLHTETKKSYLDASWTESFKLNRSRQSVDPPLFFILLTLLCFGLVICFSSYYQFSTGRGTTHPYYFIGRQLQWALLGLLFAAGAAMVRIEFIYKITPALWVLTVFLNILPALGLFGSIRGGSRWLDIGSLSFQPSELAKLTLALYLSRVLYRKEEELDNSWMAALKPALMTLFMCTPIYFQTDLSTTIFIFGMSVVIFFLSGVAMRYIIAEIGLILSLGIPTILLIGYRANRIMTWLNPDADPQGLGWQPLMARSSIEAGGLFGVGLGEGSHKLGRMSLVSSDYVFTVVGEELGLIGMAFVILLFVALIVRGWQISMRHQRSYERIMTLSLVLLIAGQAFLNMAVVSGLLPVTGVPLPFFSAGGSSIFVTLIMSGLLINLSKGESR
jgi:cell division protein FtsW